MRISDKHPKAILKKQHNEHMANKKIRRILVNIVIIVQFIIIILMIGYYFSRVTY